MIYLSFIFLLFSSNLFKRKYHQAYFLTIIDYITFPVGAGVLPIMLMLCLIVYLLIFINGLLAMIGTVILLVSQGNMLNF